MDGRLRSFLIMSVVAVVTLTGGALGTASRCPPTERAGPRSRC